MYAVCFHGYAFRLRNILQFLKLIPLDTNISVVSLHVEPGGNPSTFPPLVRVVTYKSTPGSLRIDKLRILGSHHFHVVYPENPDRTDSA